jgi:hypothetical protein
VPADADTDRSELARAVRERGQVREHRARVGVVGADGLADLAGVASVRAGLIVGNLGARGLELVEDLRDGDDEAVPARSAAVRLMGPVRWKISEKRTRPGYRPRATGR